MWLDKYILLLKKLHEVFIVYLKTSKKLTVPEVRVGKSEKESGNI
jgi:hypothetical protein